MDLKKLEDKISYTFKQQDLLLQAVTHCSFSADHNERLEFLGDSILGAVIGSYLYTHFSAVPEGMLSKLRSSLVSGAALSSLAVDLNIGEFLRLGKGEEQNGGRQRPSILENQIEAIIGAIYLDSDWQTVEHVILQWFASRLNDLNVQKIRNYKSALQEWLQAKAMALPRYELKQQLGEEHSQEFLMECYVDDLGLSAQGRASSRKKSEQIAAEKIYKEIVEKHG